MLSKRALLAVTAVLVAWSLLWIFFPSFWAGPDQARSAGLIAQLDQPGAVQARQQVLELEVKLAATPRGQFATLADKAVLAAILGTVCAAPTGSVGMSEQEEEIDVARLGQMNSGNEDLRDLLLGNVSSAFRTNCLQPCRLGKV